MKLKLLGIAVTALILASCGKKDGDAAPAAAAEEEKVLNVYNWSDYIAPDTLANFEKEINKYKEDCTNIMKFCTL